MMRSFGQASKMIINMLQPSRSFDHQEAEIIARARLTKILGGDLGGLVMALAFPENGWKDCSHNIARVDEWKIRATSMPANGVLGPLDVGKSIAFRLLEPGSFNWVVGAVTARDMWNHHEYLIKSSSHVFLTRGKFSCRGDFSNSWGPSRELGNDDVIELRRTKVNLIWGIHGSDEILGQVDVHPSKEVVPVIGLSTNGVCEIVSI